MKRRLFLAAGALACLPGCSRGSGGSTTPSAGAVTAKPSEFELRLTGPGETTAYVGGGQVVAVLTKGARTVGFLGPERCFVEEGARTVSVRTRAWIRLAPIPWSGDPAVERVFRDFVSQHAGSADGDILGWAMEYVRGAANRQDGRGITYAGDAGFGLTRDDGSVDGADFNDYLGIPWTFPGDIVRQPAPKWYRKLDCSGYLRMVYGYRGGVPLLWSQGGSAGLPRTARAMATQGPGILVASGATAAQAPSGLDAVRPGDLVFFALHSTARISHSGMYLGVDEGGRMRFLSSRGGPDGPTMQDTSSSGSLDKGLFRNRLRRVVRL